VRAVRFVSPDGETRIGALLDGHVRDAGPAGRQGFVPTPDAWRALGEAAGTEYAVFDVKLLHPVVPEKILAIGVNYRSHADESELDVPSVPVVFAKWPSSLIGPEDEIVVPVEEVRPDFEGEVAFVLGEMVYRADEETARRALGGVTAINDVSGRRAQLETPLRQFTLGKSFDTFAPLGAIAPAAGVDLGALGIRTTVSGEVMQESNTRNLIFGPAELVAYCSMGTTLEAGTVIATGTPAGVGDARTPPRYLEDGDVVEVWVEGAGTLTNPVQR